MRNITLSADEDVIDKARNRAQRENRSLNDAFRDWIAGYSGRNEKKLTLREIQKRWSHIKTGGPFTRDEMNARR